MISIYVREVNQEEGVLLGEFTPDQVSGAIELFKCIKTFIPDDEGGYYAAFLSAQFQAEKATGVYLEIVVTKTGDD